MSSSLAIVGSISGTDTVGGLAGSFDSGTMSSSLAIVGSISGTSDSIGGLVGWGQEATISSSLAEVGSISGAGFVGGLAGYGLIATISSSVATVGSISGTSRVGGLVGNGNGATIRSSVAITNSINGSSDVGGLLGFISSTIGVTASYWDNKVSFVNTTSNTAGSSQTTAALTTPTIFTGIYATWANAWCNPTTGEFTTDISSPLAIDANRVWDLGTGTQYPAITCVQNFFSLADQRAAVARVVAGESPIQ